MDWYATLTKRANELGVSYVLRRGVEYAWLRSGVATGLYWRGAPRYYRRLYSRQLRQCGLSIDPFRLRWIDPDRLSRFSGRTGSYTERVYAVGSVRSGNWDRADPKDDGGVQYADHIESTLMFQSFRARFEDGADWMETRFVQEVLDRIDNGEKIWQGCRSRSDVTAQCEYVDALYDRLQTEGYRTQAELRPEREPAFETTGFVNEQLNEIVVDIGRDGACLLLDAKHRAFLAKILGLDRIPVQVICRHRQWIAQLQQLAGDDRIHDHPDVRAMDR